MSNIIKIKVRKINEVDDTSQKYYLKDLLEVEDKIKISDTRSIYKCKIKYIYEAFSNNEIILSEDNRMIDNSRIDSLKYNFNTNKCDSVILAEAEFDTINKINKSNESDILDPYDSDKSNISESDNSDEFDDYSEIINKYLVIDGQHRITMITKLNNNDPIMEQYISLDIRKCKTREEFKNYIDSTNDRKNFSSDQLRSFKFPRLRELLTNKYHDCFTIGYIRIDESTFKTELFKTKLFEDFNITSETILDKLISINDFFKTLEDKSKLSTTKNMTKKSYIKDRSISEKMNFFLGLDSKCNWIKLLDIDSNEFLNEWNKIYNQNSRSRKIIIE